MEITFGRRSVVGRISTEEHLTDGSPAPRQAQGDGSAEFAPAGEKYQFMGPIGQGGMGEVLLVHDQDLRRDVAMKVLRAEYADHPLMKRKFVAEAQATSQLEHPGIPPVHDIGITADGKVYFTMKVVRGKALSQVLRELFLGAKEARQEFTLHRLVTVMERIAEAVHFAHEKGVIHRDLKPDNVMLGEYGEVHVMDWGIAKVAAGDEDEEDGPGPAIQTIETDDVLMTQVGTVKGTIPYMSPEQARGEILDRRSDVYALGTILYEMLALQPAFEGNLVSIIGKVRSGDCPPVETRNPRRPVPETLAAICKRAMSRDPAARPPTAHALGEELRTWLDGRAERERRHRDAEALAARGREAMALYVAARTAIDAAEREAVAAAARFKPWQPVSEKEALLAARQAVEDAKRSSALAFAETTRLLDAALVTEPENPTARLVFADLWRGRLDDAETRGERAEVAHALTMVRRYDDGRLAAYVAGDGTLELESDPEGAEVFLVRFEDRRGILVAGEESRLGATPLAPVQLAMGSYLAILRRPGFPDVRYPVHITRNREWKGRVTLRTEKEIGEGFVLVPAGPFVCGEGRDTTWLDVPEFAIAKRPVTFGEWGEFLSALEREEGLEAARRAVPSTRGDGDYMARTPDGRWAALPVNCEGAARERCLREHGPDFDDLLPVAGVTFDAAVRYCAWKTRTTGRTWRLPAEEEREKSARGVDGRRYPWGDLEDATLAKCRDSREEPTQPEPVGSFPTATSIYGMIEASGNTWDWTDSWFDGRSTSRVAKGGAWNSPVGFLRCAARLYNEPSFRYANVGLRCARSL